MSYQARCVDFAYGYKIVAVTDVVDDATRIITSVYPLGVASPSSVNSTAFENYPDRAALDEALSAAIEAEKQNLQPASIMPPRPTGIPDPLSTTRPSSTAPGPAQTAPTPPESALKAYRQTVGSETPADVARNMMGIISSVKAEQSSYVSPDGKTTRESLRGAFERLLGLKSDEIPEEQLLTSNQRPFVYFVYSLLHDYTIVQSVDGQTGLSGSALINKLYDSMVKRLQELDGHNLAAIVEAADTIRTTGTQILSTITGAKAGVTPTKQKISEEIAQGVDKAEGIKNTIENWGSTTFSPLELQELYKEELKLGGVDYQKFRFERNESGNVFATTPETASIMQGAALSSAWLNTDTDTMRKQKLDLLNRTQTFAAKHRYYSDVYNVLVDGRGFENDVNTLTMREVVSYFAACLKTMKGTCSECRHYNGASSPAPSAPNVPSAPPSPTRETHPPDIWDTIYNQAKADWEADTATWNNTRTSLNRVIYGENSSQEQKNQAAALLKEVDARGHARAEGTTIGQHVDKTLLDRGQALKARAAESKTKGPSCAFGFTNPDNTNKGPDDYCWTDSVAPGRGVSGVKYELNTDISKKIRELSKSLAKG